MNGRKCPAQALKLLVLMTMLGSSTGLAFAEGCPGNPRALGTSRTMVVSPDTYTFLGTIGYPDTLPLADHEVVLTFDDGPLPPWSNHVLDTLSAQCVKATFFLVGEMARNFPKVVQRIHDEGHTIGTHSEDHPLRFGKLSEDKLRWEIGEGIADVAAAAGYTQYVAPFFRIPGFSRSAQVEEALHSRGLVTFSGDVVADDWFHHIRSSQIASRAMSRLEKRGRGILVLHDIHKATAAALPDILAELKEKGFHVVQMVPPDQKPVATVEAPKNANEDAKAPPQTSSSSVQ